MSKDEKKHYEGHRQRLREEFLDDPTSLADYKFLELLLGYVHNRKDTKPLAKALLAEFDSLAGVLNAHPVQRSEIDGFGESSEIFLLVLHELISRYFRDETHVRKSVNLEDIAALARSRLDGYTHEEVWAAFLDTGNRLISFRRIMRGHMNSVDVTPRMVAEIALAHKASAIVLVHNHPGGGCRASEPDVKTTKLMQEVLLGMGIRFLDHLIVADGKVISLFSAYYFK